MIVETSQEKYIKIGVIAKPHGIKGALKIKIFRADKSALKEGSFIYIKIDEELSRYEVTGLSTGTGFCLVRTEKIKDRNDAENFRGKEVFLKMSELEKTGDDEYFVYELVGMDVVDNDGKGIGQVEQVSETKAYEILVVKDGNIEVLIPLIADFVKEIDKEKKQIHINKTRNFFKDAI